MAEQQWVVVLKLCYCEFLRRPNRFYTAEGHGGDRDETFIESLFPSAPEYGEDEYTVFQAIEELGDSTITKENWVELNAIC